MPTSPHDRRISQLNYSMGKCEAKIQTTTATLLVSTSATLPTSAHKDEKQEYQSSRTSAEKADIIEMIPPSLPPPTTVSSKQIQEDWMMYTFLDRIVQNRQVTAYKRDIAKTSQPPPPPPSAQHTLPAKIVVAETTTAAKRTTSYTPIIATATAERSCGRQCLPIKMPLRHLILAIMTVVVFSMEFTICAGTLLQQPLTTVILSNNTHLPIETHNKSKKINDNLQNVANTSNSTTAKTTTTTTTTTITAETTTESSILGNSLLFTTSVSPSTATATATATATSSISLQSSLPATEHTRTPLQSLQSAALVQKSPPISSSSSLTASTLDDTPSNIQSFVSGTSLLMNTELPAHSSLRWEENVSQYESGEFLSTSILNTYETSDLPPLSEAEQAAKDLLTKGFSIPTYLPPFPVFAVADLPAYLNTVSTTTTVAPVSQFRPSDAYGTNSEENLLYFDNSPDHQLQNHHKLQLARRNSSMASANVTAQVGNHAYLPCHIHRLQNKPVSWVRLRDGHIISVDQTTFIADQRFQAIFQDDKEFTWSLQIKYVQATDEGWFECQASSEPKMSAKVYLKVIVPLTELIGDQSRFVKAGSKVALHCIVRGTLDPPQYIIWYRDKIQIGENNKMGWYTQLDRQIFGNSGDNQNTIGSLIIPFVRKMDSGNYTCQPSNSASVSVDLHVLSGEYSASAIMSAARTYTVNGYYLLLLLFLLMLLHKT